MNVFLPISFTVELIGTSIAFTLLLMIFHNLLAEYFTKSATGLTAMLAISNTDVVKVVEEYNNYSLEKIRDMNNIYNEVISDVPEEVRKCRISKETMDTEGMLLRKSLINISKLFYSETISFTNYYQQLFKNISFSKTEKDKLSHCDEELAEFCKHVDDMKPILFSEKMGEISSAFSDIEVSLNKYLTELQAINELFPFLNEFDADKRVAERIVETRRLAVRQINFAKYIYKKTEVFINNFNVKLNEHSELMSEYLNLLSLFFILETLRSKNGLNINTRISFALSPDNSSGLFYKNDAAIRQNCDVIKQCHYYLVQQDDIYIMHPLNFRNMTILQLKNLYEFEYDKNIDLNKFTVMEKPISREYDENHFKLVQKGKLEFIK